MKISIPRWRFKREKINVEGYFEGWYLGPDLARSPDKKHVFNIDCGLSWFKDSLHCDETILVGASPRLKKALWKEYKAECNRRLFQAHEQRKAGI